MNPSARQYRNRILAALPATEIASLAPHLTPVTLEQEKGLLVGDITHGYFFEHGMASVVVTLDTGETVEVGVIGFEGVVGIPILLGATATADRTFVQIAGSGFRIRAQRLKEEFERAGEFRRIVTGYMQAFFAQAVQTAACNRHHTLEERLARWLLSCRDRTNTDELLLTHEFLGQMLGSRRPTVTLAANLLQKAGMIEYSRGKVTIQNRSALEGTACECYAVVREQFRKVSLL